MSDIPKNLKEQSRQLQILIDKGEHLERKLNELEDINSQLYEYNSWHQRVLNILTPLYNEIQQKDILEYIKNLSETSESVAIIRGKMFGMLQDIEIGKLNHLVYRIQKADIEDLLAQAKQALDGNDEEISNHILAAMLTGTILENSVRKLCKRMGLDDGKYKPLTQLIDKLKKNNVFNKHQANELKHWKNIRNDVAHGQFENLTPNDVEKMIAGVKRFVGDYL